MESVVRGSSMKSSREFSRNLKVILVGDSSVGKSSIIQRFINNQFHGNFLFSKVLEHDSAPTLAWDFKIKNLYINQQ